MPISLMDHPDLGQYRVVPPNRDVRVEDAAKLSDGTSLSGPDGLLVPSARQYSMILNTGTRVYSYRFDEAMRDNYIGARAMRRDAFMEGLFEERILPTINREWQLEVDDAEHPHQKLVRDGLTQVIKAIPDFDAFKRANLDGVWFGRAGTQWAYQRIKALGNKWGISRWDPIHGDSMQFTYDGVPCILLDAATVSWYASHGATRGMHGDLRSTDRGGTALVLHRPYWRDRFSVHVHMRRKADYFEGEMAGSVQGLGLRGLSYWAYVVRTDALTWMLGYMQAVGQMDLLVFNYPWSNNEAKQQQEMNASKIIGKAAIACPRDPKGNWPAVEQVPMNAAGLKALQGLITDYFDRHIERLFVGQSMSAGADKGTGLGGTGRADFARACVPVEGSEILTRRGFVSPKDVMVGEEVLAYDAETDRCRWTPLLKKSFYADAEIGKFSAGDGVFEAVCTPDHSWAIAAHHSGRRRLEKAHSIGNGVGADTIILAARDENESWNTFGSHVRSVSAMDLVYKDAGRTDVWCPTTKYGTWVMRQNGRVMITGNTKDEIIVYDTGRLDATFTNDLVGPLLRYNYPWADFPVRFKSVMPDVKAKEKVESGKVMISVGVPIPLDQFMEAGGYRIPKVGEQVIATPMPGGPPILTVMGPNGPEIPQMLGGPPGMPPGAIPPGATPGGAVPSLPPGAAPPGNPGMPMVAAGGGAPPAGPPQRGQVQNAAYGPHGYPNHVFGGNAGLPGPARHDAGVGGGVPPTTGPVMGYPGGGNTYIPGFKKPKRPTETVGFTRYVVDPVPGPTPEAARFGYVCSPSERYGWGTRYRSGPHDYCSTQINLEGYAAILVNLMGRSIRQEDLHEKGREDGPHVTVRYGLEGTVTAADVSRTIGASKAPQLTLGKVGVLPAAQTGKPYDVLKIDVTSPDLVKLNVALGQLPNTQTFTYHPHATIAYLKPGRGDAYAKVLDPLDLTVTAQQIVFSDKENNKTFIDLMPGRSTPVPTGRGEKDQFGKGENATYSKVMNPTNYDADQYTIEGLMRQIQEDDPSEMTGRLVLADALQEMRREHEADVLRNPNLFVQFRNGQVAGIYHPRHLSVTPQPDAESEHLNADGTTHWFHTPAQLDMDLGNGIRHRISPNGLAIISQGDTGFDGRQGWKLGGPDQGGELEGWPNEVEGPHPHTVVDLSDRIVNTFHRYTDWETPFEQGRGSVEVIHPDIPDANEWEVE